MKHFVIAISAGSHEFEYMCSTISEAYDAICDAVMVFGIDANLNTLMESLVDMNRGKLKSTKIHRLRIIIAEGEV